MYWLVFRPVDPITLLDKLVKDVTILLLFKQRLKLLLHIWFGEKINYNPWLIFFHGPASHSERKAASIKNHLTPPFEFILIMNEYPNRNGSANRATNDGAFSFDADSGVGGDLQHSRNSTAANSSQSVPLYHPQQAPETVSTKSRSIVRNSMCRLLSNNVAHHPARSLLSALSL